MCEELLFYVKLDRFLYLEFFQLQVRNILMF